MRIVQIAPKIGPGTGVGAVAYHLEQEWAAAGHDVSRFTLDDARAGWLPEGRSGLQGKAVLALQVLWFSTVGTVLARRRLAELGTDAISVCHNDVLAGDVYVNHGNLVAAMRARGGAGWRLMRNPLHLFTTARDALRYRTNLHRHVVNLSTAEDTLLRQTFGKVAAPTWIIPNGVDVDRYHPPSSDDRQTLRAELGLRETDVASLFVGHEYGRKGLYPLIEAMLRLPEHHHLIIVGGDHDQVAQLSSDPRIISLWARCHLMGAADPRPYYWASDVLVQASAYESYGLVVSEALACGLPVVSTPVGCAVDLIRDGENGFLTSGAVEDIAARIQDLADLDSVRVRHAARSTAERCSWAAVATAYLGHLRDLAPAESAQ